MALPELRKTDFRTRPMVIRRGIQTGTTPVVGRFIDLKHVWKRIAMVSGIGILFGFIVATIFGVEPNLTPKTHPVKAIRQTVDIHSGTPFVISNQSDDSSSNNPKETNMEIEKLKVRNRRLEALVQVLKERTMRHKKSEGVESQN